MAIKWFSVCDYFASPFQRTSWKALQTLMSQLINKEEVVDCEEVDDIRIEDEPTRLHRHVFEKIKRDANFELNLLAATLEIVAEAEQSEDDVLMEVMKCKLRTCSIKILKEITSNCGLTVQLA